MCRLAAYLGPEIALEQFLLAPPRGLVTQAWRPREMTYGELNADGYGVGWYAPDDLPAVYVSPLPIWNDLNLPPLARSLVNDLWLAAVRKATPGHGVDRVNTQPFHDDDLLFLHNGFLTDFPTHARPRLREFLRDEIEASIGGTTDSEYLFALLRHLLADDEELTVEEALAESFSLLDDWTGEKPALLNVIVSDGERLYATRHALNDDCPSLYYTTDDEAFPGAQLVASERLTDAAFWQPVPEHHILILDPDEPPELIGLRS